MLSAMVVADYCVVGMGVYVYVEITSYWVMVAAGSERFSYSHVFGPRYVDVWSLRAKSHNGISSYV